MEKLKFYSPITEEIGVVMIFSLLHKELGFKKIVSSSSRGFDISNIDYKGEDVTVEFEYVSKSFLEHGHVSKMEPNKKYVVVCWKDDCNISKVTREMFNKNIYDVIELYKYVEIIPDNISNNKNETKYFLLNYKEKYAKRPFNVWGDSHMYTFKEKSSLIDSGSKILVKEGNYIIGGFDVIRYEYIEKITDDEILNLYKQLTDYPVGPYNQEIKVLKSDFEPSHLFYDNFFEIEGKGARRTVKELLPNKGISNGSITSLTQEEYRILLGN